MKIDFDNKMVEISNVGIVDILRPDCAEFKRIDRIKIYFDEEAHIIKTEIEPFIHIQNLDKLEKLQGEAWFFFKKKVGVHYLASAGFCDAELPAYNGLFDCYSDAVEQLVDLYELTPAQKNVLVEEDYVKLIVTKHGIGYVGIEECMCDNVEEHDNDGLY